MQRKVLIYKSLYRPLLFVGCERLPFTLIAVIGGVIMMAYQSIVVFALILIFYLFSLVLIRRINTHDPQFFQCLFRYVTKYRDHYMANAFYPGKACNF